MFTISSAINNYRIESLQIAKRTTKRTRKLGTKQTNYKTVFFAIAFLVELGCTVVFRNVRSIMLFFAVHLVF